MSLMQEFNGSVEMEKIFTNCFKSLERNGLTDDCNFRCELWNEPRFNGINRIGCWIIDFYGRTPFEAMEKAYVFIKENKDKNFKMSHKEALELRNRLS